MRTRFRLASAALICFSLATRPAAAQESVTLTGPEVTIYNLAGTLQVVAGSGTNTEVVISRSGRDAARLRIDRTGSVLRVIFPGNDIIYPRMSRESQTSLSVDAEGTFGPTSGPRDRTVRITGPDRAAPGAIEAAADITVRLPTGVRLNAHVAAGDAVISSVSAPVGIHTTAGNITATGARGELRLRSASGRIGLTDTEGNAELRTASGSVRLDNVRGAAVTVRVASGDIDARRVIAPDVDLKSSSGSIRAEEIRADRVTLNSASGSVTARTLSVGEANVSTASGSINVELDGLLRFADVHAASGSVLLRVPETLGATLELRSASGDIRVDHPMSVVSQGRGRLTGSIGDGSARITARSSSGRVTITGR